jgi:heme/copper-type cytochrome/quinol oxidase subunit 3
MTTDAATLHGAVEPAETPVTPDSWGKLGMWIFLAGDAVGFGTLLAAYGVMRATSADWPSPYAVLGINLTAVMTFLLICSSVTMVKALEWLGKGDRARCRLYLLATAAGGTIFVGLQGWEWSKLIHEGLFISGMHGEVLKLADGRGASLFGASFFIVTGFHGLHVTAGVIYLLTIIRYVTRRPDPATTYNAVEIVGLYWHFVDLVWIMVFTFMYLL